MTKKKTFVSKPNQIFNALIDRNILQFMFIIGMSIFMLILGVVNEEDPFIIGGVLGIVYGLIIFMIELNKIVIRPINGTNVPFFLKLIAFLPLLLFGFGGFIGALFGFIASFFSLRILLTKLGFLVKLLLIIATTGIGVGMWFFIALLIENEYVRGNFLNLFS